MGVKRTPAVGTDLLLTTTPVRPFEDDGVLFIGDPVREPGGSTGGSTGGGTGPGLTEAAADGCVDVITRHLQAVCWWPRDERGHRWLIGDFSFYVLEFRIGDVTVSLQAWSEPDEPVVLEISSGAWTGSRSRGPALDGRRQLRDRGFAPGSSAGTFGRRVTLERKSDCRRLAREMLNLLTDCMGYSAEGPLFYRLHLGRHAEKGFVYTALRREDLVRLLEAVDLPVSAGGDDATFRSRVSGIPFTVRMRRSTGLRPGLCEEFRLSTLLSAPAAARPRLVERLNEDLDLARAMIGETGEVVLCQQVVLTGGLTAAHIHHQLLMWEESLKLARRTVRQLNAAERRQGAA